MQIITLDLQQILYPNPHAIASTAPLRHGAYPRLLATVMPPFLIDLLAQTHGNKAHAARLAGFNRSTLDTKLKQYGVSVHKQVRLLPSSQVIL